MLFRRRAYAYVTRIKNGARQVLVFRHRDYPEAGIQIPGGGIEPEETPLEGVRREVVEETGLLDCTVERELAVDVWEYHHGDLHQRVERHFFLLSVDDAPDEWEHHVTGKGEDNGFVFLYFWVNSPDEVELVPGDADYLHLVFDAGA
jgi:8-oxo-dGTP pyrophosphatase MutT (NUDIX family)